jgi:hypothetical protein
MTTRSRPGRYAPVGHQQITSLSTAVGVTIPTAGDGRASCAVVQAETQSVRWLDSGTDPTSSLGQVLAAGESMFYDGNLATLKFIETTASAKVNVTFYEDTRGGQ